MTNSLDEDEREGESTKITSSPKDPLDTGISTEVTRKSDPATAVARVTTPQKSENPAKIKVRKEDAICHIACFVGFLVIYFSSVYFSSAPSYQPKPSVLSDMLKSIDENSNSLTDYVPPRLPDNELIQQSDGSNNGLGCSLYVSDSSLPKSGLGIFTMKSIEEGETVVPASSTIKVGDVEFNPYIMLMKQHSKYDNVSGGDSNGSAIVASRDIQAGDELFFKFEDYSSDFKAAYQSLHPRDASMDAFQKVDTISSKIIESIPKKKVQVKPKKKSYKQKEAPKYEMKPSMDGTNLIEIFKDVLQDYDTIVAALLPETHSEAQSMINDGGRALYVQKNRPTEWLSKNAVCVDGIKPLDQNNRKGAFITRSVLKGDVVTTSPLYVMQSGIPNQNCFCLNSEGLMLCPLSFASYVKQGMSSTACGENDENNVDECLQNIANARYQWSKFNKWNENIENISVDHLLENPVTGLTIDLIATRDIGEGEEIFVDYGLKEKEMESCIPLNDDMIPIKWK